MTPEQLAEAAVGLEANLRLTLTNAVVKITPNIAEREQLAGSVAALMFRRYVQAAPNQTDYLERVMRMILSP